MVFNATLTIFQLYHGSETIKTIVQQYTILDIHRFRGRTVTVLLYRTNS
jgi:hypothetical protein